MITPKTIVRILIIIKTLIISIIIQMLTEINVNPGSKDYSDRQRTAVCIDAVPLPVCRHWPSGGLLIGYLSVH